MCMGVKDGGSMDPQRCLAKLPGMHGRVPDGLRVHLNDSGS
jgi:hypothetical protein